MRQLERHATSPAFVPDYLAKSIRDVDFDVLKRRGIRYIAFDADSTLVDYGATNLSAESKVYLQRNRKEFTEWCIASNRLSNNLLPLGESMDAQVLRPSLWVRKPRERYYAQLIAHFGGKPEEIAMIGDKLLQDIWGAKRAGLTTVWVDRLGKDHTFDRVIGLRRMEKQFMRRYL